MTLFLSLGARVVVNVEALNMVEAIGNVVRHRKATVVYKIGDRYELRTVPVVSGEALRHAIQAVLADIAVKMGLPVCKWCRMHEFVKHGVVVDQVIGDLDKYVEEYCVSGQAPGELCKRLEKEEGRPFERLAKVSLAEAERAVLKTCVVEDVGGFLIPLGTTVKRTSVLEVGYMVPAVEGGTIKYGFDVQFHTRHAPNAEAAVPGNVEPRPQSVYNVESSSAVYALSINVELGRIGVLSNCSGEGCVLEDRDKRVKATLLAIGEVLKGNVRVGGHWSSYKPLWAVDSAVAVVSSPLPMSVYPPVYENYVEETVKLVEGNKRLWERAGLKGAAKVIALGKCVDGVECARDVGEFLLKVFDAVEHDLAKG